MEFEIKKGIPLPRSKGKPRKYDLYHYPRLRLHKSKRSLGTLFLGLLISIAIKSLLLDS
jgi:hypothetical protein